MRFRLDCATLADGRGGPQALNRTDNASTAHSISTKLLIGAPFLVA
jgi:hypothetical protein